MVGQVLIRHLPPDTTEDSLRLMVLWSSELIDIRLLSVEESMDGGLRSAMISFQSLQAAQEVQTKLDGRSVGPDRSQITVEALPDSPPSADRSITGRHMHRNAFPSGPAMPKLLMPAASSDPPASQQLVRYNRFQSMDNSVSPTSNPAFLATGSLESSSRLPYWNAFMKLPKQSDRMPSPIGYPYHSESPTAHYFTDQPWISGKSLISNDFGDDDETSEMLRDPVAYAENGASSQRRATAPHIPISRMASLSLNTTYISPAAASLPPSQPNFNQLHSPGHGPIGGYDYRANGQHANGQHANGQHANGQRANGQHYQHYQHRPSYPPPANPADQNPPCNTLYVGNLPPDTCEEELKAIFTKQRGYKRLLFRAKQNGPLCFVEFDTTSLATKALHEKYGYPLHNSVKGGIRLSFSKNPLGVRSDQTTGQRSGNPMGNMANGMSGGANGYHARGPPPGLPPPAPSAGPPAGPLAGPEAAGLPAGPPAGPPPGHGNGRGNYLLDTPPGLGNGRGNYPLDTPPGLGNGRGNYPLDTGVWHIPEGFPMQTTHQDSERLSLRTTHHDSS